ncbi:MAG: hypothetical protein ACOH1I_00610 [Gallionellaceae bacterium]|jgi:hypothetical protein
MKKIQILIAVLLLSSLAGCYWHDRGYRGGHDGYEGHGDHGHHDRERD